MMAVSAAKDAGCSMHDGDIKRKGLDELSARHDCVN